MTATLVAASPAQPHRVKPWLVAGVLADQAVDEAVDVDAAWRRCYASLCKLAAMLKDFA